MMNRNTHWIATGVVLIALVLTACGGGGGATLGGGIGGTGKPALVLGTVTQLGSVKVGGVVYDTSSAEIRIDGSPAAEADLRLGMVVLLEVDDSTGAATRVEVEDLVKGPIDSVGASSLTVLGQTIEVDEQTVFGPGISPAGLAGLSPMDLVEVHGLVKGDGVISARRIEKEDSLSSFRVTGFASSIDTGLRTFAIGAQAIDYVAADTTDLPGGHPAAGQLVRVRGTTSLTLSGAIDATRVEADELEDAEDNDDVEVEGFVTALGGANQFTLGGVPVTTNVATRYEGGTAAEVIVGVHLEVEGAFVSGVLVAREVKFKESTRIEADIASISGSTLTFAGLPGITVLVTATTAYEGDASSLGDLAVGDHVEVRGRVTGPQSMTATQVKEESADTRVHLQGPVDPGAADPVFSILGVGIETSGLSDADFEDNAGQIIGRAAFFAAVATGGLAEAQGDLVGDAVLWDEVELEGEDG